MNKTPFDFKSKKTMIIHMFLNAVMSFTHGKAYNDLLPTIKEHSKYLFLWSLLYFLMLTYFTTIFPPQIIPEIILFFVGISVIGLIIYYSNRYLGSVFNSIFSKGYDKKIQEYKDIEDWFLVVVMAICFGIMTSFFVSMIYFTKIPLLNFLSSMNLSLAFIIEIIKPIPPLIVISGFLLLLTIFLPNLYVWRLRINYGTKHKNMHFKDRVFVGIALLMFTLARLIFLIFVFTIKFFRGSDEIWCRAIITTPKNLYNLYFKLQRQHGVKLVNIYSLPQIFEGVFGHYHNRCGLLVWKNSHFLLISGLGEFYIYGTDKDKTDKLRENLVKK